MTMENQRGGDLYLKSGKDACMSSNLKALHTYFYSLQENPKKKSPARLKKKEKNKKKTSSEKFDQTLSSRRKIRRTLPLGNSK